MGDCGLAEFLALRQRQNSGCGEFLCRCGYLRSWTRTTVRAAVPRPVGDENASEEFIAAEFEDFEDRFWWRAYASARAIAEIAAPR